LEKADCPTLGSLKTTSYRSSDESSLTESDAVVARDRLGAAAARGGRTCGRGVETIDRLRALAAGWGVALGVERR
jgi:hypothetical protein